jgi:chaperone required for assembly of F1-ATPase
MKGLLRMAEVAGMPAATRRFYKAATVEATDGAFGVRLDGRSPRTPAGRPLAAPTQALAALIADEWDRQGDTVKFVTMPATRLAHTALDIVPTARSQTIEGVVRFARADLLCYFADHPAVLVRRQETSWDPLLDWVRDAEGLDLMRTGGIIHIEQRPETLLALATRLDALPDFSLAGLAFASSLFGSVVLALALRAGRINAQEAMAAARLDEIFQEERWGVDADAAARTAEMALEADMAERWFAALNG